MAISEGHATLFRMVDSGQCLPGEDEPRRAHEQAEEAEDTDASALASHRPRWSPQGFVSCVPVVQPTMTRAGRRRHAEALARWEDDGGSA